MHAPKEAPARYCPPARLRPLPHGTAGTAPWRTPRIPGKGGAEGAADEPLHVRQAGQIAGLKATILAPNWQGSNPTAAGWPWGRQAVAMVDLGPGQCKGPTPHDDPRATQAFGAAGSPASMPSRMRCPQLGDPARRALGWRH